MQCKVAPDDPFPKEDKLRKFIMEWAKDIVLGVGFNQPGFTGRHTKDADEIWSTVKGFDHSAMVSCDRLPAIVPEGLKIQTSPIWSKVRPRSLFYCVFVGALELAYAMYIEKHDVWKLYDSTSEKHHAWTDPKINEKDIFRRVILFKLNSKFEFEKDELYGETVKFILSEVTRQDFLSFMKS